MERIQPFWESFRHFWKKRHLTQILLLALLLFILVTILYFTYLASQANVSTLKAGLNQATVIYDKDGDLATEISTERTDGIELKDVPKYIPEAVVSIEDERFYEHNGFDVKGISRAFFKNILSGRITGGGSTITQQLTKNALLSPEQTYKRKIEELFLAVEIEKHYEKEDILQMYLNHVYFGSGAWGIKQAALTYYNKDINDVSLSEAALLAGLLQAPSALDPYNNYEGAIARRNVVLQKMLDLNKITNDDYKKAIKEEIQLENGGGAFIDRDYPYFVDAVIDEAISKYGLTQEEILKRGYKIYTEMDQNLQATLEKTFANNSLFPSSVDEKLVQGGAVLLDPATGGVRGLVGGRGEQVFRGFNRATQIRVQPGSSLKPLVVYTPALEEGYEIDSKLQDKPFKKGNYEPQNFTKTYKGEVPMYEALQNSLNVPAVWLLDKIGIEKGIDALDRFGIPYEEKDKHSLGIALGGMTKGVSPLQMASAYSTFANEGVRVESHLITKIVGPTGNEIAEYKEKKIKVTSKSVADKMTSMLLDVISSGTGQGAKISGFQLAGKTGSTQRTDSSIGTKDQWLVGYTPNLVGAMWLGYDKTDDQHYLPSKSSGDVIPIFKNIMDQAVQYVEPENFKVLSVSDKLANEKGSNYNVEETKKVIKEKAEEIETKIKENSSKWSQVADEIKKDVKNAASKIKGKVNELIPN